MTPTCRNLVKIFMTPDLPKFSENFLYFYVFYLLSELFSIPSIIVVQFNNTTHFHKHNKLYVVYLACFQHRMFVRIYIVFATSRFQNKVIYIMFSMFVASRFQNKECMPCLRPHAFRTRNIHCVQCVCGLALLERRIYICVQCVCGLILLERSIHCMFVVSPVGSLTT